MGDRRSTGSHRTIRALALVIRITLLVGVGAAFFAKIWIGVILAALWMLLGDFLPMALLAPFYGARQVREAMLGPMVAEPPQDRGPPGSDLDALVGRRGTAVTDLDPEGLIDIGGERHVAHSSDGLLDAGVSVDVVGSRLDHLLVERSP